jgi:hypothetical protein
VRLKNKECRLEIQFVAWFLTRILLNSKSLMRVKLSISAVYHAKRSSRDMPLNSLNNCLFVKQKRKR